MKKYLFIMSMVFPFYAYTVETNVDDLLHNEHPVGSAEEQKHSFAAHGAFSIEHFLERHPEYAELFQNLTPEEQHAWILFAEKIHEAFVEALSQAIADMNTQPPA